MGGLNTTDKRDLQRVFICALIIIGTGILLAIDKVDTSVFVGAITGCMGYYLGRFDSPVKGNGE